MSEHFGWMSFAPATQDAIAAAASCPCRTSPCSCPSADDGMGQLAAEYARRLRQAEARTEALEVDRDLWKGVARDAERAYTAAVARAEQAEARLAAVEALCDKATNTPGYNAHLPHFVKRVRAAARGEGDRPAAEPVCDCPEADPLKRMTRYTVAASNLEPHAVGCPRHGMQREAPAPTPGGGDHG